MTVLKAAARLLLLRVRLSAAFSEDLSREGEPADDNLGTHGFAQSGDVRAVVQHFKQDKAVIVGHDWGGMVAWSFAMAHPEMTEKLIILNLPHPNGLLRELAHHPEQQKNSAYSG